jgi:hypothetical protein
MACDFLRQKESVTLENETNQMAERLQALREQMNREKELRDAAEAQKVSQLLKRIVILICFQKTCAIRYAFIFLRK